MNYLAHGYRFLESPLFLAGTAVPDWLSVVDRKVRARAKLVRPVVGSTSSEDIRAVGRGILRHHADDDRFHNSELFLRLSSKLSVAFRKQMPDPFDHRPGFLGHIVVELMLDATLAADEKTLLDEYYAAMNAVNAQVVESATNKMAARSTDRLAWFIDRFRNEKFLYDYLDDDRMLHRLNSVLRRVKLPRMEPESTSVLGLARELLQHNASRLVEITEDREDP